MTQTSAKGGAMSNDGGPAFPRSAEFPDGKGYDFDNVPWVDYPGMTLRDYFAAKAIHAAMTHAAALGKYGIWDLKIRENAARIAYEVADAMLKERDK